MKRMNRIQALAVATSFCLTLSPLTARAYSALYVFGDSLSDAGNDYIGTSGLEPAAPYVNGQFSNGPIWVEGLSEGLGLGPIRPALSGGTDYAFGGATTGYPATASSPVLVPSVTQQVGLFLLSAVGSVAPSSALYAVWIGSNDIFNIITNGVTGTTAQQQAQGAAQTEAAALATLAAHGARDFLVPLVGDLGATPTLTLLGTQASAAGTALSLIYDAALEADLAGLTATPGIDLTYLDTFSLLDSAIADPASYGLTNVTSPCYVGLYTGGGSVCATPDQYLFWDNLHPTAVGQALIARAALEAVPEPATLAILATGLAGVATLRQRRKPMPA
jgi:phospholipase/lecithinase/hemolysin